MTSFINNHNKMKCNQNHNFVLILMTFSNLNSRKETINAEKLIK